MEGASKTQAKTGVFPDLFLDADLFLQFLCDFVFLLHAPLDAIHRRFEVLCHHQI
jgi:hypothetical protein